MACCRFGGHRDTEFTESGGQTAQLIHELSCKTAAYLYRLVFESPLDDTLVPAIRGEVPVDPDAFARLQRRQAVCAACDAESSPAKESVFLSEEVLAAIQIVERDIMVEPAGDRMWAIYLGHENGSIGWEQLQQMQRCHAAAMLLLKQQPRTSQSSITYQLRRRVQGGERLKRICLA